MVWMSCKCWYNIKKTYHIIFEIEMKFWNGDGDELVVPNTENNHNLYMQM